MVHVFGSDITNQKLARKLFERNKSVTYFSSRTVASRSPCPVLTSSEKHHQVPDHHNQSPRSVALFPLYIFAPDSTVGERLQ
jgi:hypothetical protein